MSSSQKQKRIAPNVVLYGDWDTAIPNIVRAVSRAAGHAVKQLSIEATEHGQEIIATQPANTMEDWTVYWRDMPRWQLNTRHGSGRVDSGAMARDFSARVTRSTQSKSSSLRISARVGWPEGAPEYYTHQNEGYTISYAWAGSSATVKVEGMNVVDKVSDYVQRRSGDVLRDSLAYAVKFELQKSHTAGRKATLKQLGYSKAKGITAMNDNQLREFEATVDAIVDDAIKTQSVRLKR